MTGDIDLETIHVTIHTFQLGPNGPLPVFCDLNVAGSSSGL